MSIQSFLAKFGLPLLSRELTQLAARRRTYVVRVLYALVLYATALWFVREWYGRFPPESFELLGQGRTLFERIVQWQFVGIFLFLPAMTCGAITAEKERGTLPLLQLTKLNVWTILFEKLASRLMEMGTYLLLVLPLAAMAYALGGLEEVDILKAVYVLVITAFQVGSFSLLCSVWFRTTAGSMIGAYLIGPVAMIWGSWLVRQLMLSNNPNDQPLSGLWVLGIVSSGERGGGYFEISSNDPSADVEDLVEFEVTPGFLPGWLTTLATGKMQTVSPNDILERSLLMIASACVCLLLARLCFWKCANTGHVSFLKILLARMDWLIVRINSNWITRGIAWGGQDLPSRRPVAWYERRRRFVGRPRNLAWLLLLVEVPLILWLAWQSHLAWSGDDNSWLLWSSSMESLRIGLWFLALMIVVAVSTSIIPHERSRQTFDVLLVTPLAPRDIVLQKMAGLIRLTTVLYVPLLTVLLFEASFELDDWSLVDQPQMLFLRRLTATVLYLPLVGWVGFQSGLRMKNQLHAIFACAITLSATCVVPKVIEFLMRTPKAQDRVSVFARDFGRFLVNWMNPWFVGFQGELDWHVSFWTSDIFPRDWFPFLFHFLIVGGMLWAVRRNALMNFSRIVRRMEPPSRSHVKRTVPQPPLLLFDAVNPLPDNSIQNGVNGRNSADANPNVPSPGTKND